MVWIIEIIDNVNRSTLFNQWALSYVVFLFKVEDQVGIKGTETFFGKVIASKGMFV